MAAKIENPPIDATGEPSPVASSVPGQRDALADNLQAAAAALPQVSAATAPAPKREAFNPILHESTDGTKKGAVFNADGSYRRKRGRPIGTTKIRPAASPTPAADVVADSAAESEQRRARCEAKIRQGEKIACAIIGDHAALDKPDREMLIEPLVECDRLALFGEALDPRVSLLIVVGLLAIPRILHPDTIGNLRKFAEKFRRAKPSNGQAEIPPHTSRGMAASEGSQ